MPRFSAAQESQDTQNIKKKGFNGLDFYGSQNESSPQTPPTQPPQISQNQPSLTSDDPQRIAILKDIESGDFNQARRETWAALEKNPKDPQLQAVDKLLAEHVREPRGMEKFKAEAKALMARLAPAELQGQNSRETAAPIFASPIAWFGGQGRVPAQTNSGQPFIKRDLSREGSLKMNIRDYSAAESDLTRKIAGDPKNAEAYRLRALARRYQEKLEAAYADATTSLRLNPKDGRSHDVRALILMDMGNHHQAIAEANSALELNPRDANAFAARSAAWDKLDQPEKSLADLKQAADLDPQFAELYRQALGERRTGGGNSAAARLSNSAALYALAAGLAFLLFTLAIISKSSAPPIKARTGSDGGGLRGFRIIKQVGQGGMGLVYEALDEVLQRKVALKKMREEIAADPRERKRFLREARTVAALKHPNIIEIYSVIEKGEELYLVFEHLQGQTLDQELSRRKLLTPAETLAVMRQLSPALDYAHSRGVIHQDLKPSNIMICRSIAKIMDFGIARRVLETLSTLSRAEVVGTPAYMAPEQELGQLKKESDIFALGVCLYEMLSGSNPFPAGSNYLQKMRKEFRPLSETKAGLPSGLDRVIDTALSPLPAQRYPSARALLGDLQKILQ